MATRLSGASSWMCSAQGGFMLQRSRKARRARGPSSNPAIASILRQLRRSRITLRLCGIVRRIRVNLTDGMTDTTRIQPDDTLAHNDTSTSHQHQQQVTTQQRPFVLVLGGTGKVGRRIAARLTAQGVPARIGTRSAAPPFDWNDPATWSAVLDGAQSAFISYAPDLAVPGAPRAVAEFTKQAAAQRRGPRRAPVRARRGRGRSRRTAHPARTAAVDDRAVQLVRPELQRELPARPDPRRPGRTSARHRYRAIRGLR